MSGKSHLWDILMLQKPDGLPLEETMVSPFTQRVVLTQKTLPEVRMWCRDHGYVFAYDLPEVTIGSSPVVIFPGRSAINYGECFTVRGSTGGERLGVEDIAFITGNFGLEFADMNQKALLILQLGDRIDPVWWRARARHLSPCTEDRYLLHRTGLFPE